VPAANAVNANAVASQRLTDTQPTSDQQTHGDDATDTRRNERERYRPKHNERRIDSERDSIRFQKKDADSWAESRVPGHANL
jgi:hypothetical protein